MITIHDTVKSMKKADIVRELRNFGISATLRPRKSTLVALLVEKIEDTMKRDIVKATEVKPSNTGAFYIGASIVAFCIFAVLANETGVSPMEFFGTIGVLSLTILPVAFIIKITTDIVRNK